jgi:hypothetical protein
MTSKEIRRLDIQELLVYADTGEQERVEAALELLRRRQAKQLRKHSRVRPQTEARERGQRAVPQELARIPDTPRVGL